MNKLGEGEGVRREYGQLLSIDLNKATGQIHLLTTSQQLCLDLSLILGQAPLLPRRWYAFLLCGNQVLLLWPVAPSTDLERLKRILLEAAI